MKKLNITKEAFEKSQYFKNKYGKLEYVSESGKVFKTNKGKVLMFKESKLADDEKWIDYPADDIDSDNLPADKLPWNVDSDNNQTLFKEIHNYLKSLGDDLLYETLTREPDNGEIDSPRPLSWDFQAALEKARNIVCQEISDECGEDIVWLKDVTKHVSPKEYARRLVDCVLERKPTKTIAKKLAKIGY